MSRYRTEMVLCTRQVHLTVMLCTVHDPPLVGQIWFGRNHCKPNPSCIKLVIRRPMKKVLSSPFTTPLQTIAPKAPVSRKNRQTRTPQNVHTRKGVQTWVCRIRVLGGGTLFPGEAALRGTGVHHCRFFFAFEGGLSLPRING